MSFEDQADDLMIEAFLRKDQEGEPGMKTNEQIFVEFIADQKAKALTVEWVLWMLDLLSDENSRGTKINPAWLRASHSVQFSGQPQTKEPDMIYE